MDTEIVSHTLEEQRSPHIEIAVRGHKEDVEVEEDLNENNQPEMVALESHLNKVLGYSWWKKYVAAAFWSNISTPINLSITMMTALTTAQATTQNLLPKETYVGLSIATLIVTTLNTFFRPHTQMTDNMKIMSKWQEFGSEFEKIYFTDNQDQVDYKRRLKAYKTLQFEVSTFRNQVPPESYNFCTDIIYYIARRAFLKKREAWLDYLKD